MADPGLQQEVEEAAARIGILRHDGRYPDFSAGYKAAAESRKPMSGSQRRVIEAVVERVLAGESAKRVAGDYPDEYGYGPVLDNLERAIDSRDQRIKEAVEVIRDGREVMGEIESCPQCHGEGEHAADCSIQAWQDMANAWEIAPMATPVSRQEGAEATPDIAETAWAIIDHHRQHRTAG